MTHDPPQESDRPTRRAWRTDAEWARLQARIEGLDTVAKPPSRIRRSTPWLAAASLVVAVGVGWRLIQPVVTTRTLSTAAGERASIRLPDHSVVTLGPASTVRYRLGGTARDVELSGLASFKVVHDAARPFVVRAHNAITTDLGTDFVVRAYPGDSTVEVSVTAGLVSLAGATTAVRSAIELHAGEVGRVTLDGSATRADSNAAESRAAWVDGRLVFTDQSLRSVTAELSRWFDVDFAFSSETLARRRVTAVYNDPSLADVLEALTMTLGLRADRNDRVITLSPPVK